MSTPRPYRVYPGDETPAEPLVGWYFGVEDDEGETVIRGPFDTKGDAEEAILRYRFNIGEEL